MDEKAHTVIFQTTHIPVPHVLKRLGYPSGSYQMKEPMKSIFDEEAAKAVSLFEPRGIFRVLKISGRDEENTRCGNLLMIHSRQVTRLLKRSTWAGIFFVTIGPALEEESGRLGAEGELTRSLFLDAIGSETVDAFADRMHRERIREEFGKRDFLITARFSPGYGDWPLTVQKMLWETCEAEKIDIRLNDSFLMIPRKSVSAVFGLVPRERQSE
jgi:hypothetical protein